MPLVLSKRSGYKKIAKAYDIKYLSIKNDKFS